MNYYSDLSKYGVGFGNDKIEGLELGPCKIPVLMITGDQFILECEIIKHEIIDDTSVIIAKFDGYGTVCMYLNGSDRVFKPYYAEEFFEEKDIPNDIMDPNDFYEAMLDE